MHDDSSTLGRDDVAVDTAPIAATEHSVSAPVSPAKHDETGKLLARIAQLAEQLEDEREIRTELETAKRALVSEVEELSQALFEEAGSMVAKEARARAALESARRRLEIELADTRERLEDQTAQLEELRGRLQSMSISKLDVSGSEAEDNASLDDFGMGTRRPMSGSPSPFMSSLQSVQTYCEVLFPEQKFSSRRRTQHHPQLWCGVLDDLLVSKPFKEFADFVAKLIKSDSSSTITGHPYYKSVVDREVEPSLFFPLKSSTFPNRVVVSMLANECMIERIHDQFNADAQYIQSPSESSTIMAKLANSVTSLPDTLNTWSASGSAASQAKKKSTSLNTSPASSPLKKASSKQKAKCSLCNSEVSLSSYKWRMKLSPKEQQWRLMDDSCRNRIVAVGDFCAFLRHIHAGLHSARPLVDLYAEQLHHRRNIFYLRADGLPFFVVSDFEQFWRRSKQKTPSARDDREPCPDDAESSESSILYKDENEGI